MKYFTLLFIAFSGLYSCSQQDQKIENLRSFAKVYGYVKYFHPGDEASQVDWNKFAIFGASEIEKCRSKEELILTLNHLFNPIAPSVKFWSKDAKLNFDLKDITPDHTEDYHLICWQHKGVTTGMTDRFNTYESKRISWSAGTKKDQLFDFHPEFGECITKDIGEGIICHVPLVLYSNDKETYPQANKELLFKLKEELKSIDDSNPEKLSFRLGNIINTYNVFQHFYPYFDVVDVSWEKEFGKALSECYSDKTTSDHLLTLEKFTAPLKDGHIWVSCQKIQNYYTPPILWEWIEDQLVITRVYNMTTNVKVGDIVTKINGQAPKEYFKNIYSRISAGSIGWKQYRAQTMSLAGERGTKITLTAGDHPIELYRYSMLSELNPILKKMNSSYRELEAGIFYLNLDVLAMDSIKKLLPKLAQSKAIICDLRGYPNGNHEFITHLLTVNDTTKGWMQIPLIVYPDHEKKIGYEKHNWIERMKPQKPYLGNKKIVFIVDGQAISSAESYMGYIEGYHLATIIGQPTAGTNGNINGFHLPGGYYISFTGLKVLKHDGSQHHGIGIRPNVYVNKTIQGVKEGRDEFLEKAIEIVKQN